MSEETPVTKPKRKRGPVKFETHMANVCVALQGRTAAQRTSLIDEALDPTTPERHTLIAKLRATFGKVSDEQRGTLRQVALAAAANEPQEEGTTA